jgi:hypothetical protein
MTVQVTDVYGDTRGYADEDAANAQRNVDREKTLLEAAQTGDYSKIMNAKDRYGQTLAGRGDASTKLRELQSAGNTILKKYNSIQGAKTGNYSGATRDAPMILGGVNTSASRYDDIINQNDGGYAVYDSHTDAEGNQYLAVSGKNSSFIQKIDVDGNSSRVVTPPKKRGKRNTNITRVLGAFENLKAGMSTDTDIVDDTVDDIVDDTVDDTIDDTVDDIIGTDLDDDVAGSDFVSVLPSTDVQQVPAGGVATVDPNIPQTVTQQVGPVTYQGNVQTGTATTGQTQIPTTGTFSAPIQSSGLSAVPSQVTYKSHYAGTPGAVPQTLVTTQPGIGQSITTGYQTVYYVNDLGQRIPVTEFNGNPTTYVPPGFYKEGTKKSGTDVTGTTTPAADTTTATTTATGTTQTNMGGSQGGVVQGFQTGGLTAEQFKGMQQGLVSQTMQPLQAPTAMITPTAAEFIPVDAGQTTPIAPFAEAATTGTAEVTQLPTAMAAGQATPATTFTDVTGQTQALLPQQTAAPSQTVTGQTQDTTAVSDVQAAQGQALTVQQVAGGQAPVRTLQTGPQGEVIVGTGVDQAQVGQAFGTGQVQAASVQDELAGLMQQFEGGETPAWAAGSMRRATQMLAARGLGASSLAGQAVIQAAMEAALPIAQIDAGNKQQMAMLKAEQRARFMQMDFDQAFQAKVQNAARISEIANINFSAEQQVALENSRAANTMELSNLSNRQAVVLAEAAQLASLETQGLSNLQQAQVANAQNFLQLDMANLSNKQQTAIFKAQQNISSLFTDAAAENAAEQFNATSTNQTAQFFANLNSQAQQFNATQINAMDQFNVNSVNALREFNSGLQQQRDLFNAQNGLVIAQANAKWRQNIATLNTATQNQSNMDFAQTINALTGKNLDELWQKERDLMDYTFKSSENAKDRALNILLADKKLEAVRMELEAEEDAAKGSLWTKIFFGDSFGGIFS